MRVALAVVQKEMHFSLFHLFIVQANYGSKQGNFTAKQIDNHKMRKIQLRVAKLISDFDV
jgi:hypothetical protein